MNLQEEPINTHHDGISTRRSIGVAEDNVHETNLSVVGEQDQIDWKKVGRIYKPTSDIESIVERELNRLKKAMEKKIEAQDIELEEKAMALKTAKKK